MLLYLKYILALNAAGIVGRLKRAQYVHFTVSAYLSLPLLDERHCRQYSDWVSACLRVRMCVCVRTVCPCVGACCMCNRNACLPSFDRTLQENPVCEPFKPVGELSATNVRHV
jgi:hypothetical protein